MRRLPLIPIGCVIYLTLGFAPVTLFAETTTLMSPDFERGLKGWKVSEPDPPMSVLAENAAHNGKNGLHVTDTSGSTGANVRSKPIQVEPGTKIELTFQACNVQGDTFLAVSLVFLNQDRTWFDGVRPSAEITETEWKKYELQATAPQGATAFFVWIHSWKRSKGEAYLDDFDLQIVQPEASAHTQAN